MSNPPTKPGTKTADDKQGQADDVKALPPAEDKTAADWLNPTVHDAELVDEPAETHKEKLARLTKELADAEAAAMVVRAPVHDKLLILAGGAIVETSGAIPTHHADKPGGFALPVVGVLPHPNTLQ